MAEPNDIDRVRARIHRQRERLARGEPPEAAAAEAVPTAARPLATRQGAPSSILASLGRIVADHPSLAIGIGAVVLVAGPRRALRIARKGMRGAIVLTAVYRSAATVMALLPLARSTPDRGPIDETRPPGHNQ